MASTQLKLKKGGISEKMRGLKDKVAIVTGAGQWIGRAGALRLAEEGSDVVVNDIVIERANKVADEIRALGRKALAIEANVTKSQEVEQMVKQVLDEFGKIDILVNNAGGGGRRAGAPRPKSSMFWDSIEEDWDHTITQNLKSTRNCCRAVINHMIERKFGKIVNMCSSAGIIGNPGSTAYSAAKAGIIGFTRCLAKEVGIYGIRVNCVCPGPIGKPTMTAERVEFDLTQSGVGRMGRPGEVAATVAFLASMDADFTTGEVVSVCGLRNLGEWQLGPSLSEGTFIPHPAITQPDGPW